MNIAFRADGDGKKGMGHLMRCSAIASEFIRQGDSVVFYSEYQSKGLNWLREKGFKAVELKQHSSLLEEAFELASYLSRGNTDVVFVDSYWLIDEYYPVLKQSGAVVAAIDDSSLTYRYDCDVIVNDNFDALAKDYSSSNVKLKLLGHKFSILRQEFREISPAPFREHVETILITMGGADVRNFTPVVLKALGKLENINLKVICGPLMENIGAIERAADLCQSQVEIIRNPVSMAKLMAQCDIAISAGGGTVKELFAMGVVPLFVLQAANQLPLQQILERYNLSLVLGNYTDVDSSALSEAVNTLLDTPAERKRIRQKILQLVCREGVANIVNSVSTFTNAIKHC
ncbi:UDP-2,4-diacetamido-2,4,6-trideoxy-beta-L-altropyranose hydrolase [Desulfosporosinus acididurans]|uniref:UDP-2,4-diacetamido-2,4, 6-trideoxy-beta-L-altropyranose hydrolase n=1 Tax=Desulfosporosinus acididurans TaxID=476652 RepID=A0A0J1IME5_9FIRM|nr:UDP-2,4-diacetamido-2,4,6-trideoxy-beta-L-altropyranose hydrolase [Desulfosporosinus acididurans]KLU65866.1 UDP-2,4-diacetamido-2,4,6-trideoxy-beta-L-altropyranose hydrolase [Desulfosporosinus acididurans]